MPVFFRPCSKAPIGPGEVVKEDDFNQDGIPDQLLDSRYLGEYHHNACAKSETMFLRLGSEYDVPNEPLKSRRRDAECYDTVDTLRKRFLRFETRAHYASAAAEEGGTRFRRYDWVSKGDDGAVFLIAGFVFYLDDLTFDLVSTKALYSPNGEYDLSELMLIAPASDLEPVVAQILNSLGYEKSDIVRRRAELLRHAEKKITSEDLDVLYGIEKEIRRYLDDSVEGLGFPYSDADYVRAELERRIFGKTAW